MCSLVLHSRAGIWADLITLDLSEMPNAHVRPWGVKRKPWLQPLCSHCVGVDTYGLVYATGVPVAPGMGYKGLEGSVPSPLQTSNSDAHLQAGGKGRAMMGNGFWSSWQESFPASSLHQADKSGKSAALKPGVL